MEHIQRFDFTDWKTVPRYHWREKKRNNKRNIWLFFRQDIYGWNFTVGFTLKSQQSGILYVSYKRVKQHHCPFKSCEEVKQLRQDIKKVLPRGAQMGDAKTSYSQTERVWASRLLSVVSGSRSCLLCLCVNNVAATQQGFTSSCAVFTVSPLRRFVIEWFPQLCTLPLYLIWNGLNVWLQNEELFHKERSTAGLISSQHLLK